MHSASMHRNPVATPTSARLAFTGLVALAEAGHLAWERAQGGIVSHHLLNDPALPALWNGWGLVLLPLLAWIASRRLLRCTGRGWRVDRTALSRLAAALAAGAALSIAFASGHEHAAGGVLLGIGLSALAVRAYRPDYLLGFVLGMAWTFGAILPALIGGLVALVSAITWLGLYPLLRRAGGALRT